MSKRDTALALCRVAGYHEDQKAFVRAYVENRISYAAAQEAYCQGLKAKQDGVECNCSICKVKAGPGS